MPRFGGSLFMIEMKKRLYDLTLVAVENILSPYLKNTQESIDIKSYLKGILDEKQSEYFALQFEDIKDKTKKDLKFTYESDPAANSIEEIAACYPGIYATIIYRIAHVFYELNEKIKARICSEFAHSRTGIDIHPGAKIDSPFFIDHGTGIVIGETTIIGKNVKMYQGVTLGALSLDNSEAVRGKKRHPTIEDNVTMYAYATILGGNTVIKKNSIIGSNALVTKTVEENSKIVSKCKHQ